jgi:hypothetical protein
VAAAGIFEAFFSFCESCKLLIFNDFKNDEENINPLQDRIDPNESSHSKHRSAAQRLADEQQKPAQAGFCLSGAWRRNPPPQGAAVSITAGKFHTKALPAMEGPFVFTRACPAVPARDARLPPLRRMPIAFG